MRGLSARSSFVRPDTAPPVAQAYRLSSPKGLPRGHEPHYHPDTFELCYVAQGNLEWWIADEVYAIQPGDVLAIPPGVAHGSTDSTLQPCEYFAAHLVLEELPASVAHAMDSLVGRYAFPQAGESVRAVFEAYRTGALWAADAATAHATIALTSLFERARGGRTGKTSRLVDEAQAALAHDGDEPIRVEKVAKELGVSSVWLAHLFREETGVTPGDWVRARRLAAAKRMLSMDDVSVTEIAAELGYRSSQSFATAFRHACGMSPSSYRARHALAWPDSTRTPACAPIPR